MKEEVNTARYKKLLEEQKIFDTQEPAELEVRPQELPSLPSDWQSPVEGCVPSIPPVSERVETFETDISALNLSPKSKAAKKLK